MPACVPKGWMSACGVLALRKFRLCLRTICPYSFCASFAFRLRGFQFAGSRHIMQDMQAYASICKHMQSMRTSSPSAFKNVLETAASSMSCLRPWVEVCGQLGQHRAGATTRDGASDARPPGFSPTAASSGPIRRKYVDNLSLSTAERKCFAA